MMYLGNVAMLYLPSHCHSNRGDLMSKLVLLERDNKALATQLAAERNKVSVNMYICSYETLYLLKHEIMCV